MTRVRDLAVDLASRVPARVQTKLLVAFLAMVALFVLMGAVGLRVLSGMNERTNELIELFARMGFTVAAAAGCVAYSVLFVTLSIVTSRALLAGLGYVLIWEGLVSSLFDATAYLSIRHYTLGIADMISSIDKEFLDAELAGPVAVVLVAGVTAGALWTAIQRLETLELGEAE